MAPISRDRLPLDAAVELTRTGDLWLFRGASAADQAIRVLTNAPVNHVGMAIVVDDLPPLMWHAELGKGLLDVWSGNHHRGVQLHDLREAVVQWCGRYEQHAWLRQLSPAVTRDMESAALKTVARLDGTPFPATAALAGRWLRGRARRQAGGAYEKVDRLAKVLARVVIGTALFQETMHRHGVDKRLQPVVAVVHRLRQGRAAVVAQAFAQPVALVVEHVHAAFVFEHQVDLAGHQAAQFAPAKGGHQVGFAVCGAGLPQRFQPGAVEREVESNFGALVGHGHVTQPESGQQFGGQRAIKAFAQTRQEFFKRLAARSYAEVGQLFRDQAGLRRHRLVRVAVFEAGVHRIAEGAAPQRRQVQERRMRHFFRRGRSHGQHRFGFVGGGAVFFAADPGAADQR